MLQLFPRWPDEHVAHEERMIGSSTDNSHTDPVSLIPTGISVNDIDSVAGIQIVDRAFSVDPPDLWLSSNCQQEGSIGT